MTDDAREAFLDRVRNAVAAGNRAGLIPSLPERGNVGYQGAGPDPVTRFQDAFSAAGGQPHLIPDRASAVVRLLELVKAKSPRRVLVGRGPFVDPLEVPERLRSIGIEVMVVDCLTPADAHEPFFQADLGISGVDYLVAETGSIALLSKPREPRSLSLLPPVHIAIADRSQIVSDLFDLFEALAQQGIEGSSRITLPSCVSLITGPSKTGDIELKLVTGVHGPGEVHVLVIGGFGS